MAAFIVVHLPAQSIFVNRPSRCATQRRTPFTFHKQLLRARLDNASGSVPNAVKPARSWESLRAADFDSLIEDSRLPLCLIGMSNCGKSHWTNRLVATQNFVHVCVDDEIEHAIQPELTALGYAGIRDMARWMGYPSDERFARNEMRYLEIEERVTSSIVPNPTSNFVLDTTGSVIYLSPRTLDNLRSNFFIVHLAASDRVLESLRRSYFEQPKPVVWGNAYSQLPNEMPEDALRRCYEGLLRERLKRYYALAHVSIPAEYGFSTDADIDGLFGLIRGELA